MFQGPEDVGVIALFAFLVIKEVFALLGRRNGNGKAAASRREEHIEDIHRDVRELHVWHNREDADGVKVWYTRRSLERSIKQLSKNVEILTDVILKAATVELRRGENERSKDE